MSLFDKLFSRSKPAGLPPGKGDSPTSTTPQRTTEELRKDPKLVAVFDKYGRELFITKEEWRKNVLPGAIRAQWNNPEQLYQIIISSLNDGFRLTWQAPPSTFTRLIPNLCAVHARGELF